MKPSSQTPGFLTHRNHDKLPLAIALRRYISSGWLHNSRFIKHKKLPRVQNISAYSNIKYILRTRYFETVMEKRLL